MADKITVTIELDADLKAEAEKLYNKIDLTLEEAIPILIKYNVEQDTKPFDISEANDAEESATDDRTSAYGALAKYANPAMIPFEDGALERLMVKKYAQNIG